MATHPTRRQNQAADRLAEALLAITEAARLDEASRLDAPAFADLAGRIARVSAAFPLDQIVARALERRGQALGLRSDTAELLTLLESNVRPLDLLLVDDDAFRDQVARIEQELGDL